MGRLRASAAGEADDGPALIAEYRYNWRGHRLGWTYDTDGDLEADGSDLTYFFVYDLEWRSVAAYLAGDDSPKER